MIVLKLYKHNGLDNNKEQGRDVLLCVPSVHANCLEEKVGVTPPCKRCCQAGARRCSYVKRETLAESAEHWRVAFFGYVHPMADQTKERHMLDPMVALIRWQPLASDRPTILLGISWA